ASLRVVDSSNAAQLIVQDSGNVGIGTAAPGAKLEVSGATGSTIAAIINNGTSTGNILSLQDNGSAVFTVADGGAVTATSTLAVQGASVTIGSTTQAGT